MNDEELKNREALAAFIGDAPFTRPGEPPEPADLERARAKRRRVARREETLDQNDGADEQVDPFVARMAAAFANPILPGDLLATDPPARAWLVEGVLPAREPALLLGQGAAGKGHLLMYLAIRVATGQPFAEFAVPRPARVLLVNLEDAADEVHRRLHAAVQVMDPLRLGRGEPWRELLEDNLRFVTLRGACASGVPLDDPRFIGAVADAAARMTADLVVLDPIGRMLGGREGRGIELNSQEGAGRVHNAADAIVNAANAAVVLTHHVSKAGRSTAAGEDRGAGSASGSHLLDDLSRSVIRVVPKRQADARKAYGIDAACAVVSLPKSNFSGGFDSDLVFSRGPGGALRWEPYADQEGQTVKQVRDLLNDQADGLALREWSQEATLKGVSREDFRRAVATLEDRGEVTRRPGQKGRRGPAGSLYSLAENPRG